MPNEIGANYHNDACHPLAVVPQDAQVAANACDRNTVGHLLRHEEVPVLPLLGGDFRMVLVKERLLLNRHGILGLIRVWS